jgi:hypothetical protein
LIKKCLDLILFLFFVIFAFGCFTPVENQALYRSTNNSNGSQLQTREFQTKVFDTEDSEVVLKAILNVLQDGGYSVKNLDFSAGYFNGQKETVRNIKLENGRVCPFKDSFDATINVTKYGVQNKVRANFNYKFILMEGGDMLGSYPEYEFVNIQLDDPQFYQDFFNKVDKAIFIENQKL